ncbi:MAG: DUF1127 domain-containing protein [Pseudomonadota bacterium]
MAETAFHSPATAESPLRQALSGLLHLPTAFADAHVRAREFERLSALSDDALARKGLTRAEIARTVFRDVLE